MRNRWPITLNGQSGLIITAKILPASSFILPRTRFRAHRRTRLRPYRRLIVVLFVILFVALSVILFVVRLVVVVLLLLLLLLFFYHHLPIPLYYFPIIHYLDHPFRWLFFTLNDPLSGNQLQSRQINRLHPRLPNFIRFHPLSASSCADEDVGTALPRRSTASSIVNIYYSIHPSYKYHTPWIRHLGPTSTTWCASRHTRACQTCVSSSCLPCPCCGRASDRLAPWPSSTSWLLPKASSCATSTMRP